MSDYEEIQAEMDEKEAKQDLFTTAEDLAHRFKYHPPTGQSQMLTYKDIRDKGLYLARAVASRCPNCRERSIAFTKIEEAVMWANAAIARSKE